MEQRRIPLSKEVVEQLSKLDESISHWSSEVVRLDLQRKTMFENVDGLYQGRQSLLDKVMIEAGIDPSQVAQMRPIRIDDENVEMAVLVRPKTSPGTTSDASPDTHSDTH
jgi:hypothetical protein